VRDSASTLIIRHIFRHARFGYDSVDFVRHRSNTKFGKRMWCRHLELAQRRALSAVSQTSPSGSQMWGRGCRWNRVASSFRLLFSIDVFFGRHLDLRQAAHVDQRRPSVANVRLCPRVSQSRPWSKCEGNNGTQPVTIYLNCNDK